jgi:caa(3)-type oxidase subunit IV
MEGTPNTPARKGAWTYVIVFVVLAVITAVELLLSSPAVSLGRSLLNVLFVILSLGKAALVAAFYMHLRSDNRLYTYIFGLPVILLLVFALLVIIR